MVFLSALPASLRSIELSFLEFVPWYRESYRSLFEEMHARLGWRERTPENRPKIIVFGDRRGRTVDVSVEVEDYLYRDGENPFTVGSNPFFSEKRHYVFWDVGREVDVLDPDHQRPEVLI
jgi:hypothetical protein